MDEFEIGDTVQMTGPVMHGNVGTVVHRDEQRARWLVRIDAVTQNWFATDELRPFRP